MSHSDGNVAQRLLFNFKMAETGRSHGAIEHFRSDATFGLGGESVEKRKGDADGYQGYSTKQSRGDGHVAVGLGDLMGDGKVLLP